MTFVRSQSWLLCRVAIFSTVFLAASLPLWLTPAVAAPTLMVNGSSAGIMVAGGTTVSLAVTNVSGTPNDCVTLDLAAGLTADPSLHYGFAWVPGSTATLSFVIPSTPGVYAFRLWQNCSKQLALSSTITVQSSSFPSLTANGSSGAITVPSGASVTATVQNGPGNRADWIGLYPAGAPSCGGGLWLDWFYLNGTKAYPNSGLQSATVAFVMPATADAYEFRFFLNDTCTKLATSPTVTIAPSVVSASVPPANQLPELPANQLPELPRVYVDTTMPTPTATVTACGSGCDLQAAINAANLGDVIELQAGATYSGRLMLPNKTSGTGWIIIRSSAWQNLPPPGTRVGPQHASLMAKITTDPAAPYQAAVTTLEGAHHYRFIGIEVTGADPAPNQQYGLVLIDGSHYDANGVYQLQPTNALTPHHIVIDHCYIHGTPTGEFIRGVLVNGLHIAIVDSYLSNFHSRSADTQAAIAWNTPGPLKLVNNYLEAAGENVMFGGAASATAGYVPSDIEIRNNFFDKPLSWRPGDPAYAGVPWLVKNLIEFKNGQRALIEGNVFGHHWAGGQAGFFFVLTPRGEYNQNPWAVTSDITFRYNRILKTTAGLALSGTDGQLTQKSNRVLVEHNVFENIGAYVVPGAFNGEFSMPANAIQNLTIRHNTIFNTATPFHFTGDSVGPMNGFTVVDNIFNFAGYGIVGDSNWGVAELDAVAPGWVMSKNALVGAPPDPMRAYPPNPYPVGNLAPATVDEVGYINRAGVDFHLAAGSPYKNAASDGKDIGADIDAVNAATACGMSGACGTP